MGKLHELLAVESQLASQANELLKSTKELFAQPQKLLGQLRKYRPIEEGGKVLADEITNLSTTVTAEMALLFKAFGTWVDASIQKEVTNQQTAAKVKFGNKEFELPAPALLNLESKLLNLRSVIEALPVNDTTERWDFDKEADCWISAPRITYRTEKLPKAFVAYEATKEHPAQVQIFTEDVRVGEWTTLIKSGMISPSQKRGIISRLDEVAAEVKKARQRANDVEVVNINIADALLSYIWE